VHLLQHQLRHARLETTGEVFAIKIGEDDKDGTEDMVHACEAVASRWQPPCDGGRMSRDARQ
jgi:hypothetical protein|tara:strand:- start:77 stop:262 length:186 start_codon:yes stop_codon:yes gene_type:complete